MNNIIFFFKELSLNSGAIWIENETIKLSTPKKLQNEETKNFIINNKTQIISILNENNIFSKDQFLKILIFKDNISNSYPLSPAQERLWFIEQYEQGSNAYHLPAVYELDADTDTAGIKYALQQIVSRHEVLRSTIEQEESEEHSIQRVHDEPLLIEEVTLRDKEDFESLIREDINRPFDLSAEYPIRVKFYNIQSDIAESGDHTNKTLLLINTHHIASDAWSIDIFERELLDYYDAYINNDMDFCLPALEIQYKDYAVWQRSYLSGEILERQLSYWKDKLSGYQTLELPTDYARPVEIDYRGSSQVFIVDEETSQKLRALAQRYGVTLYSVMSSSINILLSKYTGQEDIITGSVIANRHNRQTEGLIGFFVNTLANRTLLNKTQSYEDLIQQVHQEQIQTQLYQDLPFEKLVEELGVERDPSRHPVFQLMFGVQSYGSQDKATEQPINYLIPFDSEDAYEVAKFDLSIFIYDGQEEIMGQISYATALFHKDTIERLIRHYIYLLEQLTEAPEQPYSQHTLLSPEEYEEMVYEWNLADKYYPNHMTVHQLFEDQAEKTPDNIALVYEGQQLNYKQLNEKSNQLARHIREQYQQRTKKELNPDTLIALCLDRSLEMVIGILAVLKAGGAYVPMDTNYPQERIDYLLEDTKAELVLSQRQLSEGRKSQLPLDKVIYIDLAEEFYKEEDTSNLPQHSKATDLAYVIYTSGTTGKPKGVMVEHHQILTFVIENNFINYGKVCTVAGVSNYAFDGSIFDIFFSLINGKKLILIDNNYLLDLSILDNQLNKFNVDTIFITTALFNSLVQNQSNCLGILKQILFGGEACNREIVNNFKNHYEQASLIHVYGPTENIVYSTYCNLSNYSTANVVPIGKHLSDKYLYVLDNNCTPVPIGVTGELHIGGAGVARGYLNKKDLTEERFIPNPFVTQADKEKGYTRLYKTGDLVRWLPDGNLEYIGRNDDQVKIRGFRIELGEIEHALSQITGIRQSCVLAKERKTESGGNKYLVGYYILDNSDDTLSQTGITDKLSQVLPEYMVPDTLVAMESFPLTINGKLDKRALPDPDFSLLLEEYVAPITEREAALCSTWQVVLGLERVGITDNFFRIGGNSILAIQVSHRMSRALECDVRVADVFKYKTISQLLRYSIGQTQTDIPIADMDQSVLSFAQERLWFIEQYEQGSNAYHIPIVIDLDADTDLEGIKYSLQQIVTRHVVLRSTIEQGDNEEHGIQLVHEEPLFFEEIILTDKQDFKSLIEEDIKRPFDLSAEYPIRVKFYTIQSAEVATENPLNRTVLLINFHHIASDGWSIEIFQKEWAAYYEAYINNDTHFCLPELEIQYKDYAVWQRTYLTGDILKKQLSYWKDKLSGFQTLELPTDFARPGEIDYSGSSREFSLGKVTSQKLRALAQRYGVTLYSVMLSSINILLSKYSGQEDIVTGSVIANRHHRQTEGLIGFFVNTQVNRTLLNRSQSFVDLVQQIHQDQVEAQLYQDLPFEKLVEELGVERDISRHPVFQVMFGIESFGSQHEAIDEQKTYHKPLQTEIAYEVEKFDLSINIDDSRQELMGQISYATALFQKDTIERLIHHYTYLLDQLTESPQQPYSQHSLLSPEEYEQIVYEWNDTDKDYPKDKTIYQLFQEQAEKTPDNIALVYEGQRLSYKQLNEKSNQLARHIREQYQQRTKQSLAPDTLIALYLDRSLEMVIGILAVLKAGGAYVPMDLNYPQERIDYLLEDTQAELILSQRQLNEGSLIQLPQDKVIYTDLEEEFYKDEDTSNLPQHCKATDLAYVIYTSGTTGKPKGVMIEHGNVSNLVNDLLNKYSIDFSERFLLFANYVFDASVEQMCLSLLSGGTLYVIETTSIIDSNSFENYIVKYRITHLHSTPTYLSSIDPSKLPTIKRIVFGAEYLAKRLFDQYKTIIPTVINEYGPTESTITSLVSINSYSLSKATIQNTKAYVLDPGHNPVPIGVIGELYLCGAGLARGYLNSPDLTAERFIANPFATEADKAKGYTRLYKTGDLVRRLPEGNMEYIGRNDDQVKIRGFRIELGEIEHALSQITGIRQSCVLAKERKTESGSNKYLVGYYVSDNSDNTLSQTSITDKLSQVLPEYMVPSTLVAMESFPLTINGKLDKQAFPNPDFSDEDNYIKPNTELEIRLCQVYAEVLGLASDQISTHQSFFRMGGNSILSIQLKGKLNRLNEFNHISVADLFKYNSINKLIQSIQKDAQTEYKHHQNIIQSPDHEVAIIGVSGAFSGANNVAELWQLIANQLEGIQFYSKEECNQMSIDDTLLEDPGYIAVEGKVEDIKLFDPFFWEMSPNEAKQLNPQIRKFIEHCWFALESSGYAPHRSNHNIGVFAGSGSNNYFYDHILNGEMADEINMWEASTSNSKDALATKVAYLLDLTGPANSINTACSTGLVSVVEACKNLQLGTCNMALAGGVSLSISDEVGYIYEEGMILSKDGHCKPFDKESSGTTGGSGVAVVLLKRLKDAIRDDDNILGVIKGYATNNDGARKTDYTAPSLIGQSECIINAQKMAGIKPEQIDYVECHGTGTNLGDPIEVQALREAFQYNQPKANHSKHKTVLGAVKANIGHTDSAAGTAGLIKVVAMLEHNIIPGQVNFNEPNPELHLDQTNFEIIKENRAWLPDPNKRRLAGVSSFGIGGTNAHVIISDYIADAQNRDEIREISSPSIDGKQTLLHYIIPLSAKSRQSLERYKQALVEYLTNAKENNETLSIPDIAYTLQERREHFNFRSAYSAGNIDELISKLRGDTSYAETNTEGNNKVVFMFPGQGAQYYYMAKALYDNEVLFKKTINQLITIANQHLAIDLYEVMYPLEKATAYDINETQWTQISLFIIEYGLGKYLEHLGVKADAYIGHSIGEYVTAALSGVFTLDDAIKLVIARGKLMQSMQVGSMLAINAKEETIKTIVKEHDCEISVINSPEDVVVSGTDKDIKTLQEALEKQAIPTVKLNTSHAYHSKMMDQAANEFEKVFKNVKLNKPTKDFVSNVTGEIAGEEVTTAGYWSKQLRNTVQFAKGINNLSKQYNYQVSFIEVGTGKGLSSFVNKYKTTYNYKTIQTVQLLQSAKEANAIEDKPGWNNESKSDIIATLWMNGIITKPNDTKLFAQSKLQIGLPSYQFDYQRCWIEKSIEHGSTNQLNLLSKEKWFSVPVWSAVSNLDKYISKDNTIFNNALVFIRRDQLNLFEFSNLADDIQIIVLDTHESNVNNIETSKLISIDPENEHHFEKLGKLIKAKNISFDTIIHMSSIENVSNLNDALCYSFYSLFLIRQHLLNNTNFKNLLVLTNGLSQITNEDVINPSNGTLVGAVRNINHEYLTIDAKVIDIGSESQSINLYISQIYDDISYQKNEELLAVRFGKLWKQNLENIDNSFPVKNTIHDDDIILISGGLGGIALSIARHISRQHKVKFILVSRKNIYEESQSDYIKEKISIIEDIKKTGSTVDVIFADIYCIEQVDSLIDKVKKNHGNITGIIHTAGVSPLGVDEYSLQNIKSAFKGKVYGIDNIINTIDVQHLIFLVSTSSLASIMGDVNRIEYCASNSYLDYLSVDKLRFKNTKILSINWPGWSDIGMVKEQIINSVESIDLSQELEKLMFLNSVSQDEGSELFYQLINQTNYEQVVVSKLDVNKLKNKLFKPNIAQSDGVQITLLEDDYSDAEYQVAQIIGQALGIEQISIHDDFFKLGGNSILAIQVSHRMSSALGCDVKVADVFKCKTISQLLTHGVGQIQAIIPQTDSNRSVLSFAQERLWFIEQYEQGSNAYHIPLVIELDDDTDTEGIKYALQQIVSRHEVLRSTIEHGDGEEHGIQRVHEEPLLMEKITLTDKQDIKYLIEEDINRPFDLSVEYPIRVKFYTIQSPEAVTESSLVRTVLLINFHHIASDGWSIEIFQKEWAAYYEAYINKDTGFCLPALEIQYKDYAVWQRSHLSGKILEKQLSYWKDKLSGYQTLEFPTDYSRPGEIDYSGSSREFSLDKETSQKLRALAQRYGVTMHCVMLTSINILLGKYTGQNDIVTGSVIANRHHRQTEGLIGFFVNTQVNRTILDRSQSFVDLLQQVHQDQVEAQLYQDLPFEKLVEELGVERDLSRHPVFQVMFGIEAFGSEYKVTDEQKTSLKPLQAEFAYDVEKFDLTINIDDSRLELMGQISYSTALFHKDTIERFIRHYTYLLEQLTEAPEQSYSQHSLLSPEEYEQIVYDWNATDNDYPKDRTIYQLFQQQAEKTPDNIALVYEGQQFSYKQLNEKSNQLARYIREHYQQRTKQPLTPDTLIALYLDRSLEMVIGILAALKAGGAYVPMDTNYPQERIDYLLEDTRAEVILSKRKLTEGNDIKLPLEKVIYIDLAEELYKKEDGSNLPLHSNATDLAYLIYTSGSTGKPKAVSIEHKSVVNMGLGRVIEYKMSKSENSLQIASICFDASVEQIFVALFSGAKLTLIKKEILMDGEKCELFLNENQITHLDTVPSFLETLDFSKLKYLKRIASGGESCTVNLVNRILPYIEFYNEYGPTEATVITTQYKIEKGKEVSEVIPIGKPIHNAKLFILDNDLSIVPTGIVGEIYIGGEGLARGYLNSDELTGEKFVHNPFSAGRLYKTGDLGRWRKDGQIEYKGRKDNQVKIRGFRIELGEIEYALAQIAGIKQCCVLAKERKTGTGSDKYLVGYYVLDDIHDTLSQTSIAEELSQVLPEYMVPVVFVAMESFTLTINGKLDKLALPDPDFQSSVEEYVAPISDTEEAICNIWQEALGLDRVGITDNFFMIGGNSILAIQVSHRMSKTLGCDVKVSDIFKLKNIQILLNNLSVKRVNPDNVEWDVLINI